jgi:hypothetical protein
MRSSHKRKEENKGGKKKQTSLMKRFKRTLEAGADSTLLQDKELLLTLLRHLFLLHLLRLHHLLLRLHAHDIGLLLLLLLLLLLKQIPQAWVGLPWARVPAHLLKYTMNWSMVFLWLFMAFMASYVFYGFLSQFIMFVAFLWLLISSHVFFNCFILRFMVLYHIFIVRFFGFISHFSCFIIWNFQ